MARLFGIIEVEATIRQWLVYPDVFGTINRRRLKVLIYKCIRQKI